jgi:hypothetical protein
MQSEYNHIRSYRCRGSETILKDFQRKDKDVTILAVELNKTVMPKYNYNKN